MGQTPNGIFFVLSEKKSCSLNPVTLSPMFWVCQHCQHSQWCQHFYYFIFSRPCQYSNYCIDYTKKTGVNKFLHYREWKLNANFRVHHRDVLTFMSRIKAQTYSTEIFLVKLCETFDQLVSTRGTKVSKDTWQKSRINDFWNFFLYSEPALVGVSVLWITILSVYFEQMWFVRRGLLISIF